MRNTIAAILFTFFTASPAMAFDLYHCTVNNVTDGFFTTLDLKVDGEKISGSTTIRGATTDFGGIVSAWFNMAEDGREYVVVNYQEGRELTENISFILSDVTVKLGPGVRYTAKEGFGEIVRPVDMICEIATPI